uniref:Uncharacterized protein n=1 Tax=Ditylum brightwellii TaxID=49249 RepID=A0A7S4S3Q9_9STRA
MTRSNRAKSNGCRLNYSDQHRVQGAVVDAGSRNMAPSIGNLNLSDSAAEENDDSSAVTMVRSNSSKNSRRVDNRNATQSGQDDNDFFSTSSSAITMVRSNSSNSSRRLNHSASNRAQNSMNAGAAAGDRNTGDMTPNSPYVPAKLDPFMPSPPPIAPTNSYGQQKQHQQQRKSSSFSVTESEAATIHPQPTLQHYTGSYQQHQQQQRHASSSSSTTLVTTDSSLSANNDAVDVKCGVSGIGVVPRTTVYDTAKANARISVSNTSLHSERLKKQQVEVEHKLQVHLQAHCKPYQIGYELKDLGKVIMMSKRQVKWRFGFTNPDAIVKGQTGANCRGEEHEVTLTWSISSGKKQILLNNQEMHSSSNKTNFVNTSWNKKMRGIDRRFKLIAFSQQPPQQQQQRHQFGGERVKNQRQFDLFIDGQSFFDLTKIYDLGMHMIPPSPFASNRKGGVGGVGGRRRRTPQMHTESTPPNVAAGAAPSPSVPLLEQRRSGEFQTNTRVQNDEEDLQKAIAANISKVRTRCQVRQS